MKCNIWQDLVMTMEKAMAPHSRALARKIPWTEEPDRLQSMGLLRVRHDWMTSLSHVTFMHLEKEMATHSSVLSWRIPGTGETGRLPSMGSHKVGHDWSDLAAAAALVTNLDSIFKSRDISLPTKVHLVKVMVFPVVMYGCEIWTVQKAERQRIDAFELWCWTRLLRVPWTARRSHQSILKEISPGCSLEGMMLKLKLQYFGHLMRRVDLFEKTLIGNRRKRGRQRMRSLDGISDSMEVSLSELQEMVMDREAWRAVIHGVANCTELNWTSQMGLSTWR